MKFLPFKSIDIPVSFYLLAGRVLLGFGQLAMIRVLTSVLSPAEIGKYYLLMSVISWFTLFLINPVTTYVLRHLYGWNNAGVAHIAIRKLLLYLLLVSMGASVILLGLHRFDLFDFNVSYELLVFVIPLLISLNTLSGLAPALCNLLGKYRAFVLFCNLELWGKLVIIGLFCFFFPPLVGTVLWSVVFWGVIITILSGNYLYRCLKKTIDAENPFTSKMAKDIFMFSWPLALASALYWGQSEGYRFILQDTAGVDFLGKFVVAYSLGAALMIAIDTLFHQLYMPVFYKEISEETNESHIEAWNKYAKKLVSVCIPIGIYIACAGPFMARWLVHSSYRDVGIYAAFGAISQLFRVLAAASYFGIVAQKNTKALILPGVIGTIIALAGTWVLSSKLPIAGTGISLVLSHFIVSIGTYWALKRKITVKIPWRRVVETMVLSFPLGVVLIVAYKLGWDIMPISNILVLAVTGSGMLYVQWRLSKDIWFQSEREVEIVSAN